MKAAVNAALKNPVALGVGVALVIGVVYLIGRKTLSDAAKAAGGLVSGENAITEDTPYYGAGVLGTAGAAVDAAGGGVFSAIGGWIGRGLYDLTHPEPKPAESQPMSEDMDERNWYENLWEKIS